jgi:hypothetical protein
MRWLRAGGLRRRLWYVSRFLLPVSPPSLIQLLEQMLDLPILTSVTKTCPTRLQVVDVLCSLPLHPSPFLSQATLPLR